MRRCLILACLLALAPTFAHADEVFLKGGGRLSGRILSRTATSIEVEVGPGTITVPMSSVIRVEERRSVLHEYHERADGLRADDRDGWLRLAKWSSSQDLNTQARQAYTRVLALDPDQADANLALGRMRLDGRWVTEEESFRARGFIAFEGQWVTPAVQEACFVSATPPGRRSWPDSRQSGARERPRPGRAKPRRLPAVPRFPLAWGGVGLGPAGMAVSRALGVVEQTGPAVTTTGSVAIPVTRRLAIPATRAVACRAAWTVALPSHRRVAVPERRGDTRPATIHWNDWSAVVTARARA